MFSRRELLQAIPCLSLIGLRPQPLPAEVTTEILLKKWENEIERRKLYDNLEEYLRLLMSAFAKEQNGIPFVFYSGRTIEIRILHNDAYLVKRTTKIELWCKEYSMMDCGKDCYQSSYWIKAIERDNSIRELCYKLNAEYLS